MQTSQQIPESMQGEVDPFMIQSLVKAMHNALKQASIPDITTPAEVLSAQFTILRHTLRVMMELQPPEEREFNRQQVGSALTDLLMEFGAKLN